MKNRDRLCIVVIVVVGLVLLVVDLGRTFAYFVGPNGEIITSTLNGVTNLNRDLVINNIPVFNSDPNTNAIVASAGNSNIYNSVVTKSGDGTSESVNGVNSAIAVQSGASLSIISGSVTTEGSYSDAIYVDGGQLSAAMTAIQTKSNYSNGLVVSNNGSIIANYLDLETLGEYSSAILNYGGTVIVNGGTYKTNNNHSPLILALGDVTVNQSAVFTSEKSEGIIIDGEHTVSFNKSKLVTNNTSLYDGTTTSKSIMLYNSSDMGSGNVAKFNANGSNIVTNNGDTFYITNTKAVIKLVNNTIVNNDGNFLRIEASNFGVSGSNGGDVNLDLSNQTVTGDIIVDAISKLDMNLSEGSYFEGAINSNNQSNDISLDLSADSIISLTSDCYISSLNNADNTNFNIHLNGHDLYVNGQKLVIEVDDSSNSGSSNGGGSSSGGSAGTVDGGTDNNVSSSQQDNNGSSGNNNSSVVSPSNGGSNNSKSDTPDTKKSDNSKESSDKKESTSGSNVSGDSANVIGGSSVDSGKKKSATDKKTGIFSKDGKAVSSDELNADSHYVDNSSSVYVVDDKTLVIINIIGVLLIVTSVLSLVKNKALSRINEV